MWGASGALLPEIRYSRTDRLSQDCVFINGIL